MKDENVAKMVVYIPVIAVLHKSTSLSATEGKILEWFFG